MQKYINKIEARVSWTCILCFRQSRLAEGIMFSTCLSIRLSVTNLVNTLFYCKLAQWSTGQWHEMGQFWGSGGQRSRSQKA